MNAASTRVPGPGDAGVIGVSVPGVNRNVQILFSTPPETYSHRLPSRSMRADRATPTLALCGVGK